MGGMELAGFSLRSEGRGEAEVLEGAGRREQNWRERRH